MEAVDVTRTDIEIYDRLLGCRAVTLNDNNATEVPAVLLVGGMGTRLQSVLPSKPKPLAPVGDAPFLELLVLQLRAQGIRRLIMCTGYLADQITEQFGNGDKWGVAIEYSRESQPLGTAGAVRLAESCLRGTSDFLVMNGDSFLEVDFRRLIRLHREHRALVSMAVRTVPDAARYGTVRLNHSNQIIAFDEKRGVSTPGVINGGVYVFNGAVLERIPEGPGSLERDVFPRLLEQGLFAVEQDGMFIDIGTPEDYTQARTLRSSLQQAAHAECQCEGNLS
jgi:D-glycero-alpha-D-manno-heptose 1-phosphate guanylyltransferase